MKSLKTAFVLTSLLFSVASTAVESEKEVTLLGLDANGNEIEMPVKSKRFKKRVNEMIAAYSEEVIPALDATIKSDNKWKLRTLDLAFSVSMGFDLFDIVEASVEPGMFLRMGN